tara:strand:+ start:36 stop:482 length:447 start_codon:yes stop_codon:yes gene_type:complete
MAILFGTDTANVNKLDDYEEGTWTPTFYNSTGVVYNNGTNGEYVKIGSLVHIRCFISATAGSLNGNMEVGGLPFAGAQGGYGRTAISAQGGGWGLSSSNNGLVGLIDESYNRMQIWKGSTDGYDPVASNNFSTSGSLYLAGAYQLAIG